MDDSTAVQAAAEKAKTEADAKAKAEAEVKGEAHEKHWLGTVGTYYLWQSDAGWIVDAASRYMYLNHELTLDPALHINGIKTDSQMLAGSLRTRYQFGLADDTLFIWESAAASCQVTP